MSEGILFLNNIFEMFSFETKSKNTILIFIDLRFIKLIVINICFLHKDTFKTHVPKKNKSVKMEHKIKLSN